MNRRSVPHRHPSLYLRVAIASALALTSAHVLADAGPHAAEHHVVLPPGVFTGNQPGVQLVHDYGAMQLWRVDPAHRTELQAAAPSDSRHQPRGIVFEAGEFDPAAPGEVPARFRIGKPVGAYLQVVQFVGPVVDAWLDAVRDTGMQLVQPVSGNGYVLLGDAGAAGRLNALTRRAGFIRGNAGLDPFYKLSGELAARARSGLGSGEVELTVQLVDHAGNGASRAQVAALDRSGRGLAWGDRLGVVSTRVRVLESDIERLAQLPDVYALEVFHAREKLDEVQAQIVAGNLVAGNTAPSGPGYLAWLTGLGFPTDPAAYPLVDVVDDGLGNGLAANGAGDPTLTVDAAGTVSRVSYVVNCTSDALGDGGGGHGHINTSIVGGYDQRTGFPFVDGNGYRRGQGINPFARLAHTKIFSNNGAFQIGNCGGNDELLIRSSQDGGAAITSNSWGAPVGGNYDDSSRAWDIGTRDGDLAQAGLQGMIHVFAAGNSGSGASTVGSPGSGKNVLTVGASENVRPNDESGTWNDGCGIGASGANSAMDVIAFSSRGPVEGGRAKPEIIAPGTHVQGTASNSANYDGSGVCDQFRPGSQTEFASSSGTSHSTPAVAGVVSLLYWWLQDAYAIATPSAALVKAYLMAHPTYLTGTGANDSLPSNSQGYGMPDLDAAFDAGTARVVVDQTAATLLAGSGATYVWSGSVVDTAAPLRIALAWTDAPGAINDTTPQVNDLDLVVTANGQDYRGNRFTGQFSSTGGSADAANNYEAVFLPAGTSGSVTITITAAGIAGDGVPGNGDVTDQDFALVCTNCADQPDFTLDATPTSLNGCAPDPASWAVALGAINGYTGSVDLAASGVPAGGIASFSADPASVPGTVTFSIDTAAAVAGDFALTLTGTDGSSSHADAVGLQLDAAIPTAALLQAPADGSVGVASAPTLSWTAGAGARSHLVEVDDDPAFGSIDYSATVTGTSHSLATALNPNTQYYWRVRAANGCGNGADSTHFSFITENLVCQTFASADPAQSIGPNSGAVTTSTVLVSGMAGGSLVDADVVGLRGTHTWISDLDATLQSASGTSLTLFSNVCGSADNFHVTLDDAAAEQIGATCPPGAPASPALAVRPEGTSLSVFNSEDPQGTWTLRVIDDFNADGGQLQGWALRVCATFAPTVIAVDDAYAPTEDTLFTSGAPGVLANDLGSGLTASLVSPPANGALAAGLAVDGGFSYQPGPDFCGDDSFVYAASDGSGSAQATVHLSVACVNDAPVAAGDAHVATEDTALVVDAPGVLANDSDAENDPLSAGSATQPAGGTVVLAADGGFSYTPDADFCTDGGVDDSFTYLAGDGAATSAPASVAISVTCVDDGGASASDDAAAVVEDSIATVLDVLGNDSADPDDGALAVTAVGAAGHGSTGFTAANASYTPDPDFCGSDSFSYTVNGGDSANVAITVDCVEDGDAAATDDIATVAEDSAATVLDVLANDGTDPDPEQNPVAVTAVTQGANGAVVNSGSNATYTPNADYCGSDSFGYTISGGATATVSVSVACVEDGNATATDDTANGSEDGGAIAVDVLANDGTDPDPEQNPVTVTAVTQGTNGAVANNGSNVTYTPDADHCGADSFGYTISGGATATVSVTIACVEDGNATATDDTANGSEDGGAIAVDVLANDGTDPDPEQNPVAVTAVTQGTNGTVANTSSNVAYTPNADFCGSDSFGYTISGGATATVSVTIACVEDGPAAAVDDAATVAEDSSANLVAVLANDGADPDPEQNPLAIAGFGQGSFGTVVQDGNALRYTPAANACGADSFGYTLAGGGGASVLVTVSCVDDGPAQASDDAVAVDEDAVATAVPVLANDQADPDDGSLAVLSVGSAGNGATSLQAGVVRYAPQSDFCGADSFAYTLAGGATATVSVTVACVNDAPVAVGTLPDRLATEGEVVAWATATGFADVDQGDVLGYSASGLPGSLAIDPASGAITGTLQPGDALGGPYLVQITATDQAGASAMLSFNLAVLAGAPLEGDIFQDGFED